MTKSSRPIAVMISDVHYTVKTLELADICFRMAIDKAAELKVPLIDCGDLTDNKSILPAQVVKKLLDTCWYAKDKGVKVISIVGNHSLWNERSTEDNALDFLKATGEWTVVKFPTSYAGFNFVPYQPTRELFLEALKQFPKGSLIIAHQGLTKAWPGEYCHDRSAVFPDDVKDYCVISGHYHRMQNIATGGITKGAGVWSYVGNPYTQNFAEAEDGPKGFQVLYDDGLLELVSTNLRKHVVIGGLVGPDWITYDAVTISPGDLVWLKLRGTALHLNGFSKDEIALSLKLPLNYRLDKIPTDTATPVITNIEKKSGLEVLDELIESEDQVISLEERDELKALAREVMG